MSPDSDRSAGPTPFVVLHPSASFRRGVAGALDGSDWVAEHPRNLDEWLATDGRRVAIVADGTETTVVEGARSGTIVVALVASLEVDAYRRALAGGAHGVAHVDADPDIVGHVVRGALAGEVILPTEIARRLAGKPQPRELHLTAEETSLLQRLSEGATVVQLADEFFLAERSIRRRLQSVYVKLGVPGRAAALKRAGQLGLID